jgi:hypothetical protein
MSFEVVITDSKSGGYDFNEAYFASIDLWAKEFCISYLGYRVQDVSDVSYQWDEIACYWFDRDDDVCLFTLKWK